MSAAGAAPMATAWSAARTCGDIASTSECTATLSMFNSRHARMILSAISPRLAIRGRRIMTRRAFACPEMPAALPDPPFDARLCAIAAAVRGITSSVARPITVGMRAFAAATASGRG